MTLIAKKQIMILEYMILEYMILEYIILEYMILGYMNMILEYMILKYLILEHMILSSHNGLIYLRIRLSLQQLAPGGFLSRRDLKNIVFWEELCVFCAGVISV